MGKKLIITLDFETYYGKGYSLTLPEYNTSSYIRDPQFKVHCCAIKIGNKPSKCYPDPKPVFDKIDWENAALLAHNTAFDGFILAHHYGIVPSFYYDTVSMTRGLHSEMTRAGLDKIAKYYGLGAKHEGALENTRDRKELDPVALKRLMEYCNNDNELCHAVFQKQLEVYPQDELDLIDLTIRMFCNSPLRVDVDMARDALAHEIMEKRATILRVAHLVNEADLQSNPKFAEVLRSLGVEPPVKISSKTGMESYAFAQTDPEFIDLLEHEDITVRHLVEARLAAKSTQTETRAYRLMQAGEKKQPLPVGYNYYAAKTGRWGGTNKLNLQNLPRVDKKAPKPSDGLRRAIRAKQGHVLVVADSAQIEARMNAWQAGDQELLDIFASGGDPYCDMAKDIYGREITKGDALERFVGKVAVLGLGYQMGHKKFQTTLAQGVMGPPVELETSAAARIVNLYRAKRRKIAYSWEDAKHVLQIMSKGGKGDWGVLHYDGTSIWLPNGMGLHYPSLHYNGDQYQFKSNGVWKKVYGGLVIENVVQALARIVVAWQMLQIQRDLKKLVLKDDEVATVCMMTHDEVVTCVPKRYAKDVQKLMLKWMRTAPEWCDGIPLNAEAGYAENYSK